MTQQPDADLVKSYHNKTGLFMFERLDQAFKPATKTLQQQYVCGLVFSSCLSNFKDVSYLKLPLYITRLAQVWIRIKNDASKA